MLARSFRLTSEQDYTRVYRRGRRFRSPSLNCSVLPMAAPTRLGVVVSKKVSLKATVRNRYKRWLWAACRELKTLVPKQGYHVVLSVSPGIAKASYQDVRRELERLFTSLSHRA